MQLVKNINFDAMLAVSLNHMVLKAFLYSTLVILSLNLKNEVLMSYFFISLSFTMPSGVSKGPHQCHETARFSSYQPR